MAGLLDFLQTPQGQGLLSGVASYAMNARRGTPVNNLGRGLAGGLVGYSQANDQINQDKDKQLANQYRQMQIDEMRQKIESQKAIREASSAAYQGAYKPPVAAAPAMTTYAPDLGPEDPLMGGLNAAMGGDLSNSPLMGAQQEIGLPARAAQPGGFDPEAYRQQMFGKLAESGMVDEAMKFKPEKVKPVALGKTLVNPETGETIAVDSTWKDDQIAQREQRTQELERRLEDQRLSREQSAALRRELAANNDALRRDMISVRRDSIAQGNKPPSGYRYTPEGNLEQIPGGPADLKRQAQLEGGGTVDTVVADLRDMYTQLDEGGGITTTKNRWGSNLGAGLQSSATGQTTGKMFGTDNQSLRNTVAQKRPLLLQAIMKATGMTAKQMDSNTELKLYLSTATDPQLDLETNRRALDMIEKLYGSGAGNAPIAPGNDNKPNKPPADKRAAFNEYLDAYKRAKTPEQRKAITDRARELGVVK
jgi:hypothetical protein